MVLGIVLIAFIVISWCNLPNDTINVHNSEDSQINVNANVNLSSVDNIK